MENNNSKKCLECGHEFYGRSDKKFCSESCKNRYHNHYSHSSARIREKTFMGLSSNHRILTNMLRMGMSTINIYDLEALGFKTSLVTGYMRKKGYDELRCFDIKYRQTPERIFDIKEVDLDETMRCCRTLPQPSYGTNH